MYKYIKCISIALTFLCLITIPSYPAEVFYLGSSGSSGGEGLVNPSYPWQDRLTDFFDFTSGRSYAERSGQISGTIFHEIDWNKVSGNKSKSFLEDGWDHLTELNINAREKLWKDYRGKSAILSQNRERSLLEILS